MLFRQLTRTAAALALLSLAAGAPVPQWQSAADANGRTAVAFPAGPLDSATLAFFQPLGRNGRSCATCHSPAAGYSLTPAVAQASFTATQGRAPLFRPVDAAVCPSADVSTLAARQSAYALLLGKGLIRIAEPLPAPPALQFAVSAVADPYGCITSKQYGLTTYGPGVAATGMASVYRRPLPTVNLRFISSITDDGREPDLASQASNAVLIHEQAATAPASAQLAQITAFETGLYAAQTATTAAGGLAAFGATGGPQPLVSQPFYPGINDSFGGDPGGLPFDTIVMTPFAVWGQAAQAAAAGPNRASIGRGQTLFNERAFTVSGVAGFNDVLGQPAVLATCATCHDTPNVGTHSLPRMMDIGVAAAAPVGLDVSGLPQYTLDCVAGPLAGQRFVVTDPGQALVTGQCADIGKIKVPGLRNLPARAPYFHNGGAAGIGDVVKFYDVRFSIHFTDGEQADLAAFLGAL